MSESVLNIAEFIGCSYVNGPGRRAVIWVQGCPIQCPACWNMDYIPFIPKNLLKVEELASKILSTPSLDGVTFTGGEPFTQAEPLAELGEILRKEGLNIVTFTGYLLEDILRSEKEDWQRLLSVTDLLIDGPFIEALKADLPLRGSSNQRLHFLTDKLKSKSGSAISGGKFEVHLVAEGRIKITGFPDSNIAYFKEKLEKQGVTLLP